MVVEEPRLLVAPNSIWQTAGSSVCQRNANPRASVPSFINPETTGPVTSISGSTVTSTSSLLERAPSFAVRRRVYCPAKVKLTLLARLVTSPNVTKPGPLTLDQLAVQRPGGLGSPSSVTLPPRFSKEGNRTVRSAPAFTTGASFTPVTVTVKL